MLCHASKDVALDTHDFRVGHIKQSADAFCDCPKRRCDIRWRAGDCAQNFRCRSLLFQRFVTLSDKVNDIIPMAHGSGIALRNGERTALRHFCLAASRFNRFAACSGALSHCFPTSGQNIVDRQSSTPEVAGCA
jgi:hypothetical protein